MSVRKRPLGIPQNPTGRPKNIVVFGESGVGKSSLINLIAGRSIATTSSSAKGCTFQHKKYELQVDDTPYAIWDTAGLDEGTYGTVPAEIAEENLKRLLRDLTRANGVHLLVYCVRATRLRQTLLSNYNLFYSAICRKKVPIVAVVTGLENYEEEMVDWWAANGIEFSSLRMHFDGHACVTTLNADKVNSPVLKQRCHASRRSVLDLIANTCSRDRWGAEHDNWVSAAIADVRAMLRPTRHGGSTLPVPIVALYDDLLERPLGRIGSSSSSSSSAKDTCSTSTLPSFDDGRLMDVGGTALRVYRIHDQQLRAGARFKKQISPRGADLLLFCTSLRTDDPGASQRRASAFYESYGGDTRPLIVVVKDATSDEAAKQWWHACDDQVEHRNVDVHHRHGHRPYGAGTLQAVVRALPPPESGSAGHVAIAKLQRAIQTRALQPLDTVPTGCFSWLSSGRRSSTKIHRSGSMSDVFVEDCLTKSRVWVPWRTQ